MKKQSLSWWQLVILFVLFVFGLGFIYPFTINAFGVDSHEYFSWIKDFYTGYGSYLSWTTAAGYNQFSIIHLFSIIIGSISYKNPAIFFLLVNYSELLLLVASGLLFLRLTKPKREIDSLTVWICGLPVGIVLWTLMCLFAGSAPQSVGLQATDVFLIFVDSFIIIAIGWFLFLLNKIAIDKKIPKLNLTLFILFHLYFSLTTLRFLSGAVLMEVTLLICVLISSKSAKTHNGQDSSNDISLYTPKAYLPILGLCVLAAIFVVGYFGFFIIEPYSTSARFVLRGGEVSTVQAWDNAVIALEQFLSFGDSNWLTILLRIIYLIVLSYGVIIFLSKVVLNKSVGFNLVYYQLFAMQTVINFTLVTCAGLFSHGTIFLAINDIAHYYELSAIFAFMTVVAFILDKWKNTHQVKCFSFGFLFIASLFSLYYITNNQDIEFPMSRLLKCINLNQAKFQLKNGMGDSQVVNLLMAQSTDTRFSVIGSMATNLDYNWLRNLTEEVTGANFLVYSNPEYKANTLSLLNAKLPSLNYQDIDCNNNTGILVFDQQTAQYINQFRSVEFTNSKSWFYLSNYGIGQTLWSKMPWNQAFIQEHHEYFYYGSLLRRISREAQYSINDNLSITIDGKDISQPQPVIMTEMIHAGSGSYYFNADYALTGNAANILVINLETRQPITEIALNPTESYIKSNFSLDNTTPIAIIVMISPGSKILLNNLILGKRVE